MMQKKLLINLLLLLSSLSFGQKDGQDYGSRSLSMAAMEITKAVQEARKNQPALQQVSANKADVLITGIKKAQDTMEQAKADDTKKALDYNAKALNVLSDMLKKANTGSSVLDKNLADVSKQLTTIIKSEKPKEVGDASLAIRNHLLAWFLMITIGGKEEQKKINETVIKAINQLIDETANLLWTRQRLFYQLVKGTKDKTKKKILQGMAAAFGI